MRGLLLFLIAGMSLAAFFLAANCGDDTDDPAGVNGDDDNDDDTNTDGDYYSEECNIDYGADMGCDQSEPACQHARLINIDRYNHPEESDCAPALDWGTKLAAVALAHSKDMCDRQFFNHINPDNEDPFDRMEEAGIDFVAAGENIFMACGYTMDQVVDLAEESFMNEPECEYNHRSNILARDFKNVGVGIYSCAKDGCIYLTQDYASYEFSDLRDDTHEYCPNFD